ncbi:Sec-independent protein translocase protein TatB [Paraburkholderia bonniea]|uniref:Sec-independent protein translocase protein TatB n=1 Tax=Paraburkholderia bonniea TaxID=2152891 RepID=UPI002572BA13|nr:Sec-independent protein translocase protein TatB [Paraburkholderia bonniea]WJF90620.1 Sec-independent protein translocase protein TatB [Paraburkholderia bonniea]WJF93935.1 Sec-independent protein translocase protein TatB [Paraburkholderia bonniea]
MLDLGLTKMALIGVVALVVLGPERLPRVARTAGALFGRAQRYINDVKAEVAREVEIDELRRMKTEFESAASNVQNSIHDNLRKHEAELNDAWNSAAGSPGIGDPAADSLTGELSVSDRELWRDGAAKVKRKNWRVKQAAMPSWYKRTTAHRTRVQSGAARVARHTPATMRRPARFF